MVVAGQLEITLPATFVSGASGGGLLICPGPQQNRLQDPLIPGRWKLCAGVERSYRADALYIHVNDLGAVLTVNISNRYQIGK